MRITVIGSGDVGRAVSAGMAAAGHDVILSSRSPDRLHDWSITSGVPVSSPPDSVTAADLVVNATPGAASLGALTAAGLAERTGIIVLDLSNPLDFSTGGPRLSTGPDESLSEQIQDAFPEARVVKTLNTVNNSVMTHPGRLAEDSLQFVCGNNDEAKQTVAGMLTAVGWQPEQIVDLGDLTAARLTEHYLLLWLRIAGALGIPEFNLRLVRRP